MRGQKHEQAPVSDNEIKVDVVTTIEDLMHVFAVRAICFMEEHGVCVGQTYDGNDFQATHVLMRVADEPIGSVRIRWFHEFAQFDRTALRPSYRSSRALKRMADFAFAHVARKNFTRIVTHAAPLYARLWERQYGFRRAENRPRLHFQGHKDELIEMVRDVTPGSDAIDLSCPPEIIHRVEGRWDQPSTFERAEK